MTKTLYVRMYSYMYIYVYLPIRGSKRACIYIIRIISIPLSFWKTYNSVWFCSAFYGFFIYPPCTYEVLWHINILYLFCSLCCDLKIHVNQKMTSPALMVLYSNDAVEVRYSDQSCLQVAPCGSTFVHHESPKEVLHPAHGMYHGNKQIFMNFSSCRYFT